MRPTGLTPILNVSDLESSFDWFEKLGWKKNWDWGDPPDFAAVGSGPCEIFLCRDAQGGRGKSALAATGGVDGADDADKGVWLSIWVDDVDAVHRRCLERDIEVTYPPTDEPWNVREMHVRHPDGHVFRVGQGIGATGSGSEGESPLEIERVGLSVRVEKRLAALLEDLAEHKNMSLTSCLEETLLHTFERVGGGVASPHTDRTLDYIQELKRKHGIDYDTHGSYRFVER